MTTQQGNACGDNEKGTVNECGEGWWQELSWKPQAQAWDTTELLRSCSHVRIWISDHNKTIAKAKVKAMVTNVSSQQEECEAPSGHFLDGNFLPH